MLYAIDGTTHVPAQRLEQLCLSGSDPVFRSQDLGLVFLELRGDVPLGIGQRLPPLVVGRHFFAVDLRYFEVVAKHLVEADLQ